jgi:PKD repeat protein
MPVAPLRSFAPLLAIALATACNTDDVRPQFVTAPEPGLPLTCTAQPTSGTAPLNVVFTVSGADSAPVVQWSFGDGGARAGAAVDYTYMSGGNFVAEVTVKVSGREGVCTQAIRVAPLVLPPSATPPPNQAPRLNVKFDPARDGTAPFTVTINTCGSDDPDGDRLSYSTTFGDRTPDSSACRNTHTYSPKGTYRPTTCVSDGRLQSCRTFLLTVS